MRRQPRPRRRLPLQRRCQTYLPQPPHSRTATPWKGPPCEHLHDNGGLCNYAVNHVISCRRSSGGSHTGGGTTVTGAGHNDLPITPKTDANHVITFSAAATALSDAMPQPIHTHTHTHTQHTARIVHSLTLPHLLSTVIDNTRPPVHRTTYHPVPTEGEINHHQR